LILYHTYTPLTLLALSWHYNNIGAVKLPLLAEVPD
jgi:hypothetical protein